METSHHPEDTTLPESRSRQVRRPAGAPDEATSYAGKAAIDYAELKTFSTRETQKGAISNTTDAPPDALTSEKRQNSTSIAADVDMLLAPPLTPFKLKLINRKLNYVMTMMAKLESRAREGARLEREVASLQRSLGTERSRRVRLQRANDELQEEVHELGRALSERVANLEQYEEAARLALKTKDDFEGQLDERRQTQNALEGKLRVSARLVAQLESELEELRKETGGSVEMPKFDKRKRTSAAIRLK
ncbi:Zinc finger, CCHC domain containing [Perkinsus olseni]|uniref:Zinc finger, CCHC domain containing n=1 Tax=Perkinsus olseni TaxID=32597 RepID=A0A7J6TDW8_PEROL|nr:Zinc finger, CCHC domain containing [Perkinsus olseni]KAF4743017.1 Zinc finger, CCHC domain containing [Perkinsus olseni]